VRRKGGQIQALALPAPAAERIDAYLTGRDDVTALPAVPGSTTAGRRRVLFVTGTGARMYRAEVRALLRRLGRAAGLPADLAGSLSPHSMRHAFATLNQVWTPAPACATCRTRWGTPCPGPPAATTAAAATWTAPPATCSPGTSAGPAELRRRGGPESVLLSWLTPGMPGLSGGYRAL
jgi:hypothetical protein